MAGFVPEPGDLHDLAARIATHTAMVFLDAETRLLAEIARRITRGLPENPDLTAQLTAVRQLEAYATQLTAGLTREFAEQIIVRAARDGAASMMRQLGILPSMPTTGLLTQSQAMAAALIAYDLGNAFTDMRARILRYPRDAMGAYITGGDVYQQVIATHAPTVPLGGSTDAARKAALQEFLAKGVTGFTDVAGRNWRIGTYTEMATRTAVARAYSDAAVFRAEQLGIELFTIIGNRNACRYCGEWFGKVLAARGTSGPREVEHAFEDRLVTVHVDATITEARAAGWGHPNCTCELTPYQPGFDLPVAAEEFDKDAAAARDRLRELEVRERDAKRRLEIATAVEDPAEIAKQKARIRAIQAETREHIALTGETRRYDRAQVKFADGVKSTGLREAVLPRVPHGARVAPFVPERLVLERHELDTADRLADVGLRVRFREIVNAQGAKNIDATIDSQLWEMKSPKGAGPSTISNQLRRAKDQGAVRVVIDNARTPLPDAEVLAQLRRRFATSDWLIDLIHIAGDGTVTRLQR